MIEKLQNTDVDVSEKIRAVFQISYAVEAKLLKAIDFPPLKRSLESYNHSTTEFFGYLKNKRNRGSS